MPGAAVRYALGGPDSANFFEPEILYDVSFAGDPSKRNIGNLQFSPTLNVALDRDWFATLYPSQDIRISLSDPVPGQTGRLFLPIDASLGRRLGPGANLSVDVGVPIIPPLPTVFAPQTHDRGRMKSVRNREYRPRRQASVGEREVRNRTLNALKRSPVPLTADSLACRPPRASTNRLNYFLIESFERACDAFGAECDAGWGSRRRELCSVPRFRSRLRTW